MISTVEELVSLVEECAATVLPQGRLNAEFSPQTNLRGLARDSLNLLELVTEVEDRLEIHLPNDELVVIVTIQDLWLAIERNR
ncbi:MAG: acyl carrier protein [Candidatus Microthrix parvicella]|jgi:acyl carrier protein|uniref:acyl carrier protein n=1 Tax=Candidatus Neomicrothrix parvicella TaxID=41950 RepID=UPI001EE64C91|nr:acyl carrier protein [Candidatus Microthrix parvicella]